MIDQDVQKDPAVEHIPRRAPAPLFADREVDFPRPDLPADETEFDWPYMLFPDPSIWVCLSRQQFNTL